VKRLQGNFALIRIKDKESEWLFFKMRD